MQATERTSMIVQGTTTNSIFGVRPDRRAEVLRTYWRNGEHHHALRDTETDEQFESPAIFWEEARGEGEDDSTERGLGSLSAERRLNY